MESTTPTQHPNSTAADVQPHELPQHHGLRGLFSHTGRIVALVIGLLFVAGVIMYQARPGGLSVAGPGESESGGSLPAAAITQEFVVDDTGIKYDSKASVDKNPDALPPAENFKEFSYDPQTGKILALEGRCTDAYYAVVIFKAGTDYKADPAAAAFNTAFECPASKTFRTTIDLRAYPLPSGRYYFFIADQGKTGAWYNPR